MAAILNPDGSLKKLEVKLVFATSFFFVARIRSVNLEVPPEIRIKF